jgi:uncharacterized protein (TIGR02301 family)
MSCLAPALGFASRSKGMSRLAALILSIVLFAPANLVSAQEQEEPPAELPPPIYEDRLLRLSEILGSLTFLRDLCGEPDAVIWRNEMSALLTAEDPAPQRRARLIARFNHGFETFHAVYRSCTPSARLAISRYLAEGQALASDVRSRYSQ